MSNKKVHNGIWQHATSAIQIITHHQSQSGVTKKPAPLQVGISCDALLPACFKERSSRLLFEMIAFSLVIKNIFLVFRPQLRILTVRM